MSFSLIQKIKLTSSSPTITFNSIPQNYDDLFVAISARATGQVGSDVWDDVYMSFNGLSLDIGTAMFGINSTATPAYDTTVIFNGGMSTSAGSTANTFGNNSILIPSYTSSLQKTYYAYGGVENFGNNQLLYLAFSHHAITAPITSITLDTRTGDFAVGSAVALYGTTRTA